MQTKLMKHEKQAVRDMIEDFRSQGGELFTDAERGMTVAMIPAFSGSRMAHVGVSWQAPTEKKFRKLVGINTAIGNCDGTFQVPVKPANYAEWANEFSYLFDPLEAAEKELSLATAKTWPFPSGNRPSDITY